MYIHAIKFWVINFSYENYFWIMCFDSPYCISPKLAWNHFCHVTTKSINSFPCPIKKNICHFLPRRGYRVIMKTATSCITIVNAIIQFNGFIPIILLRMRIKAIITSTFCREFHISFCPSSIVIGRDSRQVKVFSWTIVKVILHIKMLSSVITLSKIFNTFWLCYTFILTCNMIRNKIN